MFKTKDRLEKLEKVVVLLGKDYEKLYGATKGMLRARVQLLKNIRDELNTWIPPED